MVNQSLLGSRKILAIARRDVIDAGEPFGLVRFGTLDADWMPVFARRGFALLRRAEFSNSLSWFGAEENMDPELLCRDSLQLLWPKPHLLHP